MKIGLLLPRSTYYTTISFDLLNGLRAYCSQPAAEEHSIHIENIGFGAEKQVVYRAAEQLIMQHDTEVVFAYIGHATAQLLRPLFQATNKLLIVLDAGAHLPHEWPASENIIFHSLNNSLGAYRLGAMARRDGFDKACFTTCYYDGGYLHTFAMAKGLEQAGVYLSNNVATGYTREDFSMAGLKDVLTPEAENLALFGLFSGDFTLWFMEEMKHHFESQSVTCYLAPFALEESMLSNAPYPGENIQLKGTVSWSRHLVNAENELFMSTMKARDKEQNLFSLLGWEAGQLIEILQKNNAITNGKQMAQTILGEGFRSPRGHVQFDHHTQTSFAPMYEAKVVATPEGMCELQLLETADNQYPFTELTNLNLQNAVSGWKNSYACN